MFNAPKPKLEADPVIPHEVLHSNELSRIKGKINALKGGERLTEKVDPLCFNDIWVTYKNEIRNHRQGGLGKLKIDYDSVREVITVTNIKPGEPKPEPKPDPKPEPKPKFLVFPEPNNE